MLSALEWFLDIWAKAKNVLRLSQNFKDQVFVIVLLRPIVKNAASVIACFTEGVKIPLSVPYSLVKTTILQNSIQHILLSSTIKAKGTSTGWLCKLNNASLNSAASWNCNSWILVFVELTSKVIFLVFLWQPGVL